MTENTETPAETSENGPVSDEPQPDVDSSAETAQEHTEPQDDHPSGEESGKGKGNPEAAKWRVKYREAETTIETLTSTVDKLRADIVTTALEASGTGVTLKAITANGTNVSDLFDDDGALDVDQVKAAAEAAATELGLKRLPAPNRAQGSSASGPPSSTGKTWADLLGSGKK